MTLKPNTLFDNPVKDTNRFITTDLTVQCFSCSHIRQSSCKQKFFCVVSSSQTSTYPSIRIIPTQKGCPQFTKSPHFTKIKIYMPEDELLTLNENLSYFSKQ